MTHHSSLITHHSPHPPTIMVVDDTPASLNILQDLLQREGYRVVLFPRGEMALKAAARNLPDLILLDVVMPEMDGFETCKRFKESAALKDIPVLFISALTDAQDNVRAFAAGAADFVTKPFHPSVLTARVKTHLRLRMMHAQLEAVVQQRTNELRLAHKELYQIISSIQSILIVLNEHGRVTRWNWVAAKLLNFSYDMAFGKVFDALPLTWERERVAEAIRACRENMASIRVDNLWFERPDGTDGFLMLLLNPILGIRKKEKSGVLILGNDQTEQQILESQLLQAQKLEGIGQLAAGIAHEINTPIQFVGDNLRFLSDSLGDLLPILESWQGLLQEPADGDISREQAAEFRKHLQGMDFVFLGREIPQAIAQSLDGLERVAHIVRSMKAFAHPGGESMTLVDVNKILENTVTVSRNEWKYVAEMHMDLAPDLPLIPGHSSDLGQAFLNLIINAAQAIAAAHGEAAGVEGRIVIVTRLDGDYVEVRFTDNGGGIPLEIQDKVFDPFFTTKEVGRGTGQGLVITRNAIVRRHGGTLSFESEPGRGTTFIIRLPVLQDANGRAWSEVGLSHEGWEQIEEGPA